MSKIKEQSSSGRSESAENTEDREFDKWVRQQFLEEAEDIEKEIEQIPDSKAWEPTEEKFQELLQKAKKQGTIQSPTGFIQKTGSEEDRDKKNRNKNQKEKLNSEKYDNTKEKIVKKPGQKLKSFNFRGKVIKWAAAAAVTIFGIFGVSMSSEANRAYIMGKVDSMLGKHTQTEIDNDKMLINSTTEEEARIDIEVALGVELPQFYYLPKEMKYQDYVVDAEAQMAVIQYQYNEQIIHFLILSNERDASAVATSDFGKKIDTISSKLTDGINSILWEVLDEDDKQPTHILQWDYKNVYYELSGKIENGEVMSIAENILY